MKSKGLRPSVFLALGVCAYFGCVNTPAPASPGTPVSDPHTEVIPPPHASNTVRSPAPTLPSADSPAPESSNAVPSPVLPPNPQHGPGVPPNGRPPRPGAAGACAPMSPVKSQDRCANASECAPASLCHATSCVGKANAPAQAPGLVCTMNLVCSSIDVGKCDCLDGYCALVAR